jgi:hypothetical protein
MTLGILMIVFGAVVNAIYLAWATDYYAQYAEASPLPFVGQLAFGGVLWPWAISCSSRSSCSCAQNDTQPPHRSGQTVIRQHPRCCLNTEKASSRVPNPMDLSLLHR